MIESIVVEAQFRDLISKEMSGAIKSTEQFSAETDRLSAAATSAQRGVVDAFRKMGGVAGAVTDEIRSRTDNAISTMVEFGATSEQVARAFEMLGAAAEFGDRGIAQTANALRTLADESESSEQALQNVNRALDIAAATGLKAEDAGRELGKALKGDVAILNKFDAGARAAASAIEQITEPAERSKAIAIELERALARNNSTLNRARNRFKALGAQLESFKATQTGLIASFKGLGLAVGVAGAAVSAFAGKSVQQYLSGSAKMRAATKRNEKDFKAVKFALGGIILEAVGLRKAFAEGSSVFGKLAKVIVKNRVPIAQTLRDLALGALYALQAITAPLKGIALIFTFVRDLFTELIKLSSLLGETLLGGLLLIGKIKPALGMKLTAVEKRNIESFKEAIAQLKATREATPAFEGTTKLLNKLDTAGEFVDKIQKLLETKVELFDPGTMTDVNKLKQAADALKAARAEGKRLGGFGGVPTVAAQVAGRVAGVGAAGLAGAGMEALTTGADTARAQAADLGAEMVNINSIMTDLARGGIAAVGDGLAYIVEQATAGTLTIRGLGQALLAALGDLSLQAGQAFLLLGTGIKAIESGDISGAGAIAAGVGLIALGAALKGAASRLAGGGSKGSAGDGQTARAIDRFGRRLFDRPMEDGGRTIMISVDGREMRGFVLETAAAGMYRGQLRPMR